MIKGAIMKNLQKIILIIVAFISSSQFIYSQGDIYLHYVQNKTGYAIRLLNKNEVIAVIPEGKSKFVDVKIPLQYEEGESEKFEIIVDDLKSHARIGTIRIQALHSVAKAR